jgi:hypothetical protein
MTDVEVAPTRAAADDKASTQMTLGFGPTTEAAERRPVTITRRIDTIAQDPIKAEDMGNWHQSTHAGNTYGFSHDDWYCALSMESNEWHLAADTNEGNQFVVNFGAVTLDEAKDYTEQLIVVGFVGDGVNTWSLEELTMQNDTLAEAKELHDKAHSLIEAWNDNPSLELEQDKDAAELAWAQYAEANAKELVELAPEGSCIREEAEHALELNELIRSIERPTQITRDYDTDIEWER